MKRSILALMLMLVALASPAFAQSAPTTIDLNYNVGRIYDIPQGKYNLFHVPGIEVAITPDANDVVTFTGALHFSAFTGENEKSTLQARYDRTLSKRLWFNFQFEHIVYHVDYFDKISGLQRYQDWRVSLGGRYRIKK
jgi:hypothetical protein